MKRFLVALFVIGSLGTSAFGDDNVRAAQAKLKEGGFYFGEVDGSPSSQLSAAITRYQIRHGLQITGKLDAETSKALGVKPETSAADAGPAADTWRRLRKDDQQSLASRESPTRALEPAGEDGSKVSLSRERLRDYVAAFVLAGVDPQVAAELEFFAERVRYYNDGVVDRQKIRRDLERYAARWPQRRFWLAGELQVEPQADSTLRVTFPLRYELQNGAKRSSGTVRKTLLLEVVGEDLQIVGVNERKAG